MHGRSSSPGVGRTSGPLSEEGKRDAGALAELLAPWAPELLVTSVEPKAVETGRAIADRLCLPCRSQPGLEEQDRTGVPFFDDPAELEARIRQVFERPAERALGRESGEEARDRFERAVGEVFAEPDVNRPTIVSHGTVISLFAARGSAVDGFDLWRRLAMPSFLVLAWPRLELLADVRTLGDRRRPPR